MVLDMVTQNPCRSTRGIARDLGVEHRAFHLILQDEDLYPYHYSRVQGLMIHDYHHHLQYCEWLFGNMNMIQAFLEHILWSGEAAFTREGLLQQSEQPSFVYHWYYD
jgi:hypothetical protein